MSLFILFVLLAIKGIRFQRKHAKLSEHSLDEQIKILDTLGDLYCQVKAFHKALGCYKKEVLIIVQSTYLLYSFNLLCIMMRLLQYVVRILRQVPVKCRPNYSNSYLDQRHLNFAAWTCQSGRENSQGAVTHLRVSSNNLLRSKVPSWCNQLLYGRTGNNGGKELQRGKVSFF